ncbi:MAG: hypothetical protein KDA96_21280, partial [Planctomycetaceae bacterium]|nr:hypothetical protein [Planctomycetaceae bacterium]
AREPDEPRTATVKISAPEQDRVGFTTEDFDPLVWLKCEPPADVDLRMRQIYDNLEAYQRRWEESPGADRNILEENGAKVTYTNLFGDDGGGLYRNAFTFDMSRGGLPVAARWSEPGNDPSSNLQIEPVEISGAWVPGSAKYHYRTNLKSERTIQVTWISNLVNEPIPDSVFDPANLELVVGDPIINTLTGTEERFGVESPTDPRPLPSEDLHVGTVVVTACTVLLLIALVIVRWRAKSAGSSE